jgi:DNA-directed RNA polymerase subunit RPC12/RpoP
MALIACRECGKEISDQAPACPHCGAPQLSKKTNKYDVPPGGKPAPVLPILIAGAVIVAAIAGALSLAKSPNGSGSGSADSFDWNDALVMCQHALKRISRDPEKANVPYVENKGTGDNYLFVWGPSTKMARMRNGLGLEVATSASCRVSHSEKRITALILDGKEVL